MAGGALTPAALLLPAMLLSTGGDLLTRFGARFPDCEGITTAAYRGDRYDLYTRTRLLAGPFRAIVMIEKDRGEEWCDLAAAGASLELGGSSGAAGGWLRTTLGSGLVLSHPSGWADGGVQAKPPVFRMRIEPATSPGGVDGCSMTGAGCWFGAGGVDFAALVSRSLLDPSGDGLHRTPSEIAAAGSVEEDLAALRVEWSGFGVTAAAARDSREDWFRAGADATLRFGSTGVSAEAAAGSDGSSLIPGFWACAWEELPGLRFTAGLFRLPSSFPSRRSSIPFGAECDAGAGAAARWHPSRGWTVELSAAAVLEEEGSGAEGGVSLTRRFGGGFEAALGGRAVTRPEGGSFRVRAGTDWHPSGDAVFSLDAQVTGSREGAASSEGSSAGAGLRISPADGLELAFRATGFSTDGWDSRVYCGELRFPGEFGSVAVWGSGFLLQASASVDLGGGSCLRARVSHMDKPGEESIGEGLEETPGSCRTEAGAQLEVSL